MADRICVTSLTAADDNRSEAAEQESALGSLIRPGIRSRAGAVSARASEQIAIIAMQATDLSMDRNPRSTTLSIGTHIVAAGSRQIDRQSLLLRWEGTHDITFLAAKIRLQIVYACAGQALAAVRQSHRVD